MSRTTPATAYWRQRRTVAAVVPRLVILEDTVASSSDLSSPQWAQLLAFVLELRPELVLELGRGYGNSTCVFTEAANQLQGGQCRVLSLCNTDYWATHTAPRLEKVVPPAWHQPLTALHTDILGFDFEAALADAGSVFLFWDAHGFDVAECVLGRILPLLAGRPHMVAMHDLSDARYGPAELAAYGARSLWKGGASTGTGARVRLGHVDSEVEQAIAAVDFCGRNNLTLESADHGFHTEIGVEPERVAELRQLLGERHFSLAGHWFWFTLNERPGPYTFPVVARA